MPYHVISWHAMPSSIDTRPSHTAVGIRRLIWFYSHTPFSKGNGSLPQLWSLSSFIDTRPLSHCTVVSWEGRVMTQHVPVRFGLHSMDIMSCHDMSYHVNDSNHRRLILFPHTRSKGIIIIIIIHHRNVMLSTLLVVRIIIIITEKKVRWQEEGDNCGEDQEAFHPHCRWHCHRCKLPPSSPRHKQGRGCDCYERKKKERERERERERRQIFHQKASSSGSRSRSRRRVGESGVHTKSVFLF